MEVRNSKVFKLYLGNVRKTADNRNMVQLLTSPKHVFQIGKHERTKTADSKTEAGWGFQILARVILKWQMTVSKLDTVGQEGWRC